MEIYRGAAPPPAPVVPTPLNSIQREDLESILRLSSNSIQRDDLESILWLSSNSIQREYLESILRLASKSAFALFLKTFFRKDKLSTFLCIDFSQWYVKQERPSLPVFGAKMAKYKTALA